VGERPKPAGAKSRAFSPFVACLEAEKTRKNAEKKRKKAENLRPNRTFSRLYAGIREKKFDEGQSPTPGRGKRLLLPASPPQCFRHRHDSARPRVDIFETQDDTTVFRKSQ